jgi:hypothetical protein
VRLNETLKGEIDLDVRFPGLVDVLASGDVNLFWIYQMSVNNRLVSNSLGGWVFIPRSK